MEIVNKLDFILHGSQEISHSLSLWLRECTSASISFRARIIVVIAISKVVSIVSIEINSLFNLAASLTKMFEIHIFSLLVKFSGF